MDDYLFLFHSPTPATSSLLKPYLSKSNCNMENNHADYSTFCLLNKAAVIDSIQYATAHDSLPNPEGILDSIQVIEQLDRQQGLPVSDSMRAAFCALALHCTVKYLPLCWSSYFDAVQRIWRFRIRNLEESGTTKLLGPDLPKFRDDVEAALWDFETSQRLSRINTHDEALHRIRVYLREARSSMKPAFLRLALASTSVPTVDPVSSAQAPPRHNRCTDKGKRILRVNSQTRRRHKGPVIITDSEGDRPSCSKYGSLATAEVDNLLQDALMSSTAGLLAGVTDPLPETLEVAERVESDMERTNLHTEAFVEDCNKDKGLPATSDSLTTDVPPTSVNPTMEINGTAQAPARPHRYTVKRKGILRVNSQGRRRFKGPVTISNSEEDQPPCSKYCSISTPEVNKLRDALKSSTVDLLDAVTDPLPEALEVAERVASFIARKKLHTEAIVEDGNKDVPAKSVNPSIDVPATSVNPTTEPVQENQACIQQNKVLRRCLMERNSTARTYKWEDSIDVSAEETTSSSSRCRLSSPKIRHVSPLKEYELKKWARKREVNRWTVEEEKALIEGKQMYGKQWKRILESNPEAFNNRTAVDLKDKWRNMSEKK